jgi:hypothetical protein
LQREKEIKLASKETGELNHIPLDKEKGIIEDRVER